MTLTHRSVLALVAVLVAALTAGSVIAAPVAPAITLPAQAGAQTPTEICASADTTEPESREFEAAEQVLAEGADYWAVFCTAAGPIVVDLLQAESPITVNNFVFLAQQKYFNGTTFHRVLPGFMAQGGDPTGTGSGGPGYQFEDETSNGLVFDQPGLLAMANAGAGTNGSQFFITYDLTDWLNGAHTIFGRITSGMASVELLTPRDPDYAPAYEGSVLNTVVILDDPALVKADADGAPGLEHLQAMLEGGVAMQMNEQFVADEALTGVLDQAAALEQVAANADLQTYLTEYLTAHGFAGAAAIVMPLSACPTDLASLPIWSVGFGVDDYGTAGAGDAVVADEERAAKLVEVGQWESQAFTSGGTSRLYQRAVTDHACGSTAIAYRIELPAGRYVVVADMILDSTYINATTDPTAEQYLLYVGQDLLMSTVKSALTRGNAAVE